ncbi:MAG: hypothetical protein PF485_06135 [Bacteroidales bacterium]|jgi:hypothetical protein|nr:hypothetical protein [Bacteroidales bacterium]
MSTKDYSIQVEKFLKHFQARNAQREKNGYDANTVLDLALNDYRDVIWGRTALVSGLYLGLLLLFLSRNSLLQLGLTCALIFIVTFSLLFWFYKWIPRIDYLPQIKRRINKLNSKLEQNSIIDLELIENELMLDENLRNKNLLEIYYERLGISDSMRKEDQINNLSKLLSLYYLTKLKLSSKKSDEEKIILASCLLDIGKGGLSKRFKTQLNKLINLDIDNANKAEFKELRESLNTSKHSIEEVLKEMKKAIAKIDNLPD